jgi:hypothetical protein
VDVDQPASPGADKKAGQHAHESRQRDEFDIAVPQEGVERALERLSILSEGAMIQGGGFDACLACAVEARNTCVVGNDYDDFIGAERSLRVEQRLEV